MPRHSKFAAAKVVLDAYTWFARTPHGAHFNPSLMDAKPSIERSITRICSVCRLAGAEVVRDVSLTTIMMRLAAAVPPSGASKINEMLNSSHDPREGDREADSLPITPTGVFDRSFALRGVVDEKSPTQRWLVI